MGQGMERFMDIMDGLASRRVLAVGDVFLDEYLYGSVHATSTGIKIPIIEKNECKYALGGAGNVAANLSGLSSEVTFVSQFGDDESGRAIQKMLGQCHVKSIRMECEKSIKKQRVYIDSQQVARIDDNYIHGTDTERFRDILSGIECDVIVAVDYMYGMIDRETLDLCKAKAARDCIPLIFTSRRIAEYDLSGIALIVLNEQEAELLRRDDGLYRPKQKNDLIITKGEKGIYAYADGRDFCVQGGRVYPVNVSGAGDTVLAAASLLYGTVPDMEEILFMADTAARIAIRNQLTYRITRADLIYEIFDAKSRSEYSDKIMDLEKAKAIIEIWRERKETIVFTNGCYDILHLGHLSCLSQAKKLGERLIVAVNTDSSIKRLKGEKRPVNTVEERVTALSYLEMIDLILIFEEDTAVNTIRQVKPDIYVKGEEYKNKALPEAEYAGRVEYVPMVYGMSTTSILNKIIHSED